MDSFTDRSFPMTTLGCKHCNAYKHLAVFRSKYDCPACGVYDEITGEA
jgi:hypothetical protein